MSKIQVMTVLQRFGRERRGNRGIDVDDGSAPRFGHCRWVGLAVLVSTSLLLASCGGPGPPADPFPTPAATRTRLPWSDQPTAVTSPVAAASPGQQGASPFRSGEIVWSLETDAATSAPLVTAESIPAGAPKITAALSIPQGPTPRQVAAVWQYNNTALPAFDATAAVPAGSGSVWIDFSIAMPPGNTWPAGTYEVTISIDGTPAATSVVDVLPAA